MSKIAIVGAGLVGSTTAFALMLGGTAEEIVLIDKIKEKARGEALDLNHGTSFIQPVTIYAGDYPDCRGADIVIITAGIPQKPGQSRLELVEANKRIIRQVVESILNYNTEAILILTTNPVDIMSYVAWEASELPASRVLGSGTVLDTSRFRYLLGSRCNLDPRNIHAYVIGEHGDSEVLLWSTVNIAGIPMEKFCDTCEQTCSPEGKDDISQQVRQAAYEVIEGKGATYYAVALALRRITESILRNEHSILTVSTMIEEFQGVKDVYLSLPCILGENGVEKIVSLEMSNAEKEKFLKSAEIVKNYTHNQQPV
ncbi:MAG: L-lactate dehydrogenase [Dethiobacteria bacterium]|jgi:L-lactate dehydrogenase